MIGLCCHYIVPVTKRNGTVDYENILDERKLQFGAYKEGKYSYDRILESYINNITNVKNTLIRINKEGIKSYRMSSGVLPLFDTVSEEIKNHPDVLKIFEQTGKYALDNNMRITTHPDQFVVLSSDNPNVRINSINMLSYHAWMFDKMNLPQTPYYAINIHGGKRGNAKELIDSIEKLPDNIRNRLTLENDESSYSVKKLYEVYQATSTPICFDSHHFTFNQDDLNPEEGMELAISTWEKDKPITHLSNTEPGQEAGSFKDRRKHSDYVHYIPEHQRIANNQNRIDIDFEFKMKNLSIFKAIKDFDIKLS